MLADLIMAAKGTKRAFLKVFEMSALGTVLWGWSDNTIAVSIVTLIPSEADNLEICSRASLPK